MKTEEAWSREKPVFTGGEESLCDRNKNSTVLTGCRYPQWDHLHWKEGRTISHQDIPSLVIPILKEHTGYITACLTYQGWPEVLFRSPKQVSWHCQWWHWDNRNLLLDFPSGLCSPTRALPMTSFPLGSWASPWGSIAISPTLQY